jgi:hemerythrin-like domain-containing protein
MKEAVRIIQSEHRSISAVLLGLKELTRMAAVPGAQPDWRAFRAMVRYIDEFPERFHHPKEDRYLFARVAARSLAGRELVRKLEAEHRKSAQLVRELERALVLLEDAWPKGLARFSARVDEYCGFHWDHMRTEEKDLIPLAERTLAPEDWAEVDAGFAGNADPLQGLEERNFRELFTRLVGIAPAPVGLGEPWKRAG